MGDASKNFNYSEFGCKCGECEFSSGKQMHSRTIELAQRIRDALNRPLSVNSGIRCQAYNEKIGGSLNSKHLPSNGCRAVDLGIKIAYERHLAMKIALQAGFSVGVNAHFLHFDAREGEPLVFLY